MSTVARTKAPISISHSGLINVIQTIRGKQPTTTNNNNNNNKLTCQSTAKFSSLQSTDSSSFQFDAMFVDTEAICTIALFGFITSVISTLRDHGAAPRPAARYLLVFSLAGCQSHSYRNNRRCLAGVSLRGLAFRAQARSQRSTAKKSKAKVKSQKPKSKVKGQRSYFN